MLIDSEPGKTPILVSRTIARLTRQATFFLAMEMRVQPHLMNGLLRSLSSFSLWVRVTITLADALPVAIVIAVQPVHYKGVGPYPANQFVDVLAKVGYVQDATSIPQSRISQVFS